MNFKVQVDQAGFKGEVELRFPTRAEKNALLKELQKLGYGKEKEDGKEDLSGDQLDVLTKLSEMVQERIVSIDLVNDANVKIDNKELLEVFQEGQILTGHLGGVLLGGISAAGKTTSSNSGEQQPSSSSTTSIPAPTVPTSI